MRSTSPDSSAAARVVLSGMMLKTTWLKRGWPFQYSGFASSTIRLLRCQETNLYGPVPRGRVA